MTNKELIATYDQFLMRYCGCFADEKGFRPCDYKKETDTPCALCMSEGARRKWKEFLKEKREQKVIMCPAIALDCPYYGINGACSMPNPQEDCDDYYAYMGDGEA